MSISIEVQCLVQTVDGRWVHAVGHCSFEKWVAFDVNDDIDHGCVPRLLLKVGISSLNGWAEQNSPIALSRMLIRNDLNQTSFPEGPPEDIEYSG